MTVFVGDDWAETHHDVHLMNDTGDKLAAKRLPEGLEGIGGLHALIAEHTTGPSDVVIGIETDRGMWVQTLIAAGYRVYAAARRNSPVVLGTEIPHPGVGLQHPS